MRREYHSGTRWCIWRWKDIYWRGEIYLSRLHIFQCPLFAVMVHFISQPDKQLHQHDHPVSMLCFVLKGWYVERRGWRSRMINWVNWIPAEAVHRIWAVARGGCITLVICGPRKREWGFWVASEWIPWREYHQTYGGSTS